jgi:hypothetical protein
MAYLGENNPTNAIPPLERASRLRGTSDVEPTARAETDFALGQALWESRREQSRARRLAEDARTRYLQAGMDDKVKLVDRWLHDHVTSS